MKIADLTNGDRPREKLIAKGAGNLRDAELIAILLRTGVKGKSAIELAEELLVAVPADQMKGLDFQRIRQLSGIDGAKACAVLAAIEWGRRVADTKQGNEEEILSPADAIKLVGEIRSHKKEHFLALYLDARNRVIKRETVSIGTLNASLVHPREVFEPAVACLASSVVLAHNHPSGDPTPSDADITVTVRMTDAGKIMGIEVMDHIIVAAKGYYSFREAGKL